MAAAFLAASCAIPTAYTNEQFPGVQTAQLLAPGDEVYISVFGEEQLNGVYALDDQGDISFPLLGRIPAGNRTTEQLRLSMIDRLSDGYLAQPQVTIELRTTEPFSIVGEVENPGRYTLKDSVTVLQAVAIAGGFSYRANETYAFLWRKGFDKEIRVAIDSDILVHPGDQLRIGERYF